MRFIGNRSSGKQGIALAQEIQNRGGQVNLVAINLEQDLSSFTEVHSARTALEVESLVKELAGKVDAVLMPAAIGDFRVEDVNQGKLHRSSQSELDLHLVANPDILANLANLLGPNRKTVLVGFAAHAASYEDTTLQEAALNKLTSKNIDVVVANDVSNGAVFDAEDNSVLIVSNHEQLAVSGTKAAVASAVIDFIKPMLKSQ